MKRFLFLILAILMFASTYDYAKSSGHYALLVVAGVLAALLLVEKAVR